MSARRRGGSLRLQALAASVLEAAGEVTACADPPAPPRAPAPEATLLVVQADGSGGPLGPPSPAAPPGRLGTGQTRGQPTAAVVTGLSTRAPARHPPQAGGAARWPAPERPQASARPAPVAPARRAMRSGHPGARRHRGARVARRAGPHLQHRVALTEGADARPPPLVRHVPPHPLGLAMSHATASRGDTATARRGDTPPHRTAGVRHDLASRKAGPSAAVRRALSAAANAPLGTATPRHARRRTAGYDRRHRPFLRDEASWAPGWPMGTGGIDGAWRPLVNERLAPSGRRWTTAGAHAGLDRRAGRRKAYGECFWPCHRHQPHHRLSGSSAPVPEGVDSQALPLAA